MEYISKQSLLADLNEATPRSYFAFETMVREYPTEDVVPVVHAFWFWTDDSKQRKEFQCSNCGKFVKNHENLTYLEFTETFQYCPKCGAKMDEIYLTVRLEGE